MVQDLEMPRLIEAVNSMQTSVSAHTMTLEDNRFQMELLNAHMEEAFFRLKALDVFVDQTLPIQLDLTVSAYLQEFLSVPDKLRLIEVDNARIERQRVYQEDTSDPEKRHMKLGERRVHKINLRVASVFKVLSDSKLGYGNIKFGPMEKGLDDDLI